VNGGRYAAALSEHPLTASAVGEVVGSVLEALGGDRPDLALLFCTPPHAGALEDAATVVRRVLQPGTLLGCAAESVVGGAREVEHEPAVVLWAGRTGPAAGFHLRLQDGPDGSVLVGWPDEAPDSSALLLLADPFTFPAEPFLDLMAERFPGMAVVGGMASAARGPGGNRLVVDGSTVVDGAVGAFLPPSLGVHTVVSQGCRPVGSPLVVTRSERNVIYDLAGKPALERLQEVVTAADADERKLMGAGLHLGRVIDEHKADFGRGDFLVRNVIGADRQSGALAVGDLFDIGATVQFHVRDAVTADEDLRALLEGQQGSAALLFTCNGRGTRLFGVPDHDAEVLTDLLGDVPVAGFSCAGELGPIGGRNFLHGFTASVALLG
jgi:small ligand-binding sensory domain FIST